MSGLEVLHADNHLLVVNKPAGVPMVPDVSRDESLLERAKAWVKREYSKPGDVFLGVVHRLDRPVSGVVVFARTSKAAKRLSAHIRERKVTKTYWGIVEGEVKPHAGELEQLLWKDERRNRVHVVAAGRAGAKAAHTGYRRFAGTEAWSALELVPHTGRSHQLRVACASLGAPLVGDLKYGAREGLPGRGIALHARSLELTHPTTGWGIHFQAPLPAHPVWDPLRDWKE